MTDGPRIGRNEQALERFRRPAAGAASTESGQLPIAIEAVETPDELSLRRFARKRTTAEGKLTSSMRKWRAVMRGTGLEAADRGRGGAGEER